MNSKESKAYAKLRGMDKPPKLREQLVVSAKEHMAERNRRRAKSLLDRVARAAQREPVHEALRHSLKTSSDFASVVKAVETFEASPPRVKLVAPTLPKVATPSAPFIKLGSILAVDIPPFLTIATAVENGDNSAGQAPSASTSGAMSFLLNPGMLSNGNITAFVAVGQLFVPPETGVMILQSDASWSWSANWWSTWWRLAGGGLWLDMIVSHFNENGFVNDFQFILQLFSESDQNLQDADSDGNSGNGWPPLIIPVLENDSYFCWVQMVGFATADKTASLGHSHMALFASANVPSIVIVAS